MYHSFNIAVIIPCYNEQKAIAKVINDFKTNIPTASIYVFDNNSTDSTHKWQRMLEQQFTLFL